MNLSSLRERSRGLLAAFDESATMSAALGALFLSGALIGVFSLVLPHPDTFSEGGLWSNTALAGVTGLMLIAFRGVVPVWLIQVFLLVGTLAVTRAVYYSDDASGSYTYWYLWVGVYAFFFFGRASGFFHLAAIGAAYAWVLNELSPDAPAVDWIVTVGSTAVAGVLTGLLAGRLRSETQAAATRASNLEAVGEVARQLATQSDPRAVGWAICSAALSATGASASVLWRPTPNGSELVATAAAGGGVERIRIPFVTPNSGAVQVFTGAEARFGAIGSRGAAQELAPRFEAAAGLWQPVHTEKAVVGVLAVYWTEPREGVGEEPRRALRLLALEAAIAIERGELLGRLEEAARTDDLTGLLNRRAWSTELSRELARADRERQPLCVAVLDLDRFKQFNDAHGHPAGDRFLKSMSGLWLETLRGTDILARHGGEEFALAMPNTGLDDAEQMLERMREVVPEGQTCSAGVCRWNGAESAEALLDRADTALYEAKDAGRDQVVAV